MAKLTIRSIESTIEIMPLRDELGPMVEVTQLHYILDIHSIPVSLVG